MAIRLNNVTTVYLNNVAGVPSTAVARNVNNSALFNVGFRTAGTFFNGTIDDIRIFQRALTTPERNFLFTGDLATLSAPTVNYFVLSESQDADGTWQNHNTLQGTDWLTAIKYRGDADTPYVAATVELARADRTLSMAPLMTGSVINRNAALAYAPFLDALRRIRVRAAVVATGVVPLDTDYRYVFDGYIDKVSVGGRDDNSIILECRDLGALLVDTDIEVIRQYGSSGGTAVEVVMQQILDDNLGAGAVTLYTPVSPNWFIHEFSQKTQSLMEGIRALAKQIGYEIRYVYDATNTLRLTFYAPDRAKLTSDFTIGPTVYTDITSLDVEGADVRNAWTVEYIDRATGNKLTAIATSAPSIAQYKRRPARIAYGYSSNIDSAVEAQKMVDAALADTAFPKALEVVDCSYLPIVDIADLITLQANGEHYDTDQQRAVIAYEHELRDGDGTTTLTTRGSPAGGYDTWMSMVGGMLDGPSLTVTDTVGGTPAANHSVAYSGSWDTIQLSIDGAAWIVPGPSPLIVTPNPAGGAAKQYAFRAIKNGQIVTQTVYVATPPPLPPQALINHLNTETDDTQWFLQMNAVVGSGGGGANLTWNMFKKIGFAAEVSGASGNATTLPSAQTIPRHPRSDTVVRLTVTDVITGLTHTARLTVPSARPEINNTGNPFRSWPLDDGGWGTRATNNTGLQLHLSIVDSRSALVNTMYRTTVDTADNILNSATKRVIPFTVLRSSDNALLTAVDRSALIDNQRAELVSRSQQGVFLETFDTLPSGLTVPANASIVAGQGITGQNVLQVNGRCDWQPLTLKLPFDKSKLYRGRVRYRVTVDESATPTVDNALLYAGARFYDASGATLDNTASNANTYFIIAGIRKIVADGWVEFTGWLKGWGAAISAAADPLNPSAAPVNAVSMQPMMLMDYSGPLNQIVQLDYYAIDVFDEDASQRIYNTVGPAGNIYRNRAWDDGGWGARTTNNTGLQLHLSIVDSRAFALNTHFNTAQHTMDNVPEGASFGKASFTRLGFADRAGTAIDSGNAILAAALIRSRGYSDATFATRSSLSTGLDVHSSVADSRGALVNGMYRTAVDTADNVLNSATKRVIPFSVLRSSDNVLLSGVDYLASFGDQLAGTVSKRQGVYFAENFDSLPTAATGWNIEQAPLSQVLVAGVGSAGLNVWKMTGAVKATWNTKLPYNPSKLYRMRLRAKQIVDGDTNAIYIGCKMYDASGVLVACPGGGQAFICPDGGHPLTVAAGWQTFTCYIQGATLALTTFPSSTGAPPDAPVSLSVGTAMISPMMHFNWQGTTGQAEVDFLTIEELDEDISNRAAQTINSSANIIASRAFSDGSYALASSASDRVHAHSAIVDSRNALFNQMYRTPTDTFDSVLNGGTFLKTVGINSSGQVTPSSTIGRGTIFAHKTAGQSLATGVVPIRVTWDVADYTIGQGVTFSSPNSFIINSSIATAGTWFISAQIGFVGNVNNDRHVELRQNGVVIGQTTVRACAIGTNDTVIPVMAFAPVSLSDTFEVWAWQNSGGLLAISTLVAETFFTMTHLW
jgi:hypothetical protein